LLDQQKIILKKLLNYQGELKKPFENKNKHIRSNGPTPNTKRTIFAVLGVVFFSPVISMILEFTLLLFFLRDITKTRLLRRTIAIIIDDRRIIKSRKD
tara:strand:- start:1234 stop:1527 length:294 start_codon:yes stop_codon:yes gene_type:complete